MKAKEQLTLEQASTVMAMADADMRLTDAAMIAGVHRSTVLWRLDKIEQCFGLDPRKFYDLCKLVEMANETLNNKEETTVTKNSFRGKTATRTWVCGDLIHDYYVLGDTCIGNIETTYQVDPATVGQRTALPNKDCIYEGDVLRHEGEKIQGVVVYSESDAAFVLKTADGQLYDFVDLDAMELEKIGNIHDNPELMGA